MVPLFTIYECLLIPASSPSLVIMNTFPVERRIHFISFTDDDVTLQGKDPEKNKDGKKIFSQIYLWTIEMKYN